MQPGGGIPLNPMYDNSYNQSMKQKPKEEFKLPLDNDSQNTKK